VGPSERPTDGERPPAWRLAGAGSAYLRGAAEQPIAWHPWGPEPFAEAERSRRPILLDIGAVWCHWCHVMDEGTYADPEVARLLAQHFVAIKVDRDEHPEIDQRFQRQVSALTGEGGWPLTAFLTPAGEVFLGGTYFPPEDGVGRPGFRRVLKEVARLWREEPDRIAANAEAVRGALARAGRAPTAAPELEELIGGVRHDLAARFDPVHGGFGQAPKFPHPTAIEFLLLDGWRSGDGASAERARGTLSAMAEGGLYDQIGRGFHRYSVDEGWRIPHFEKMGTDNAALIDSYVAGARRFADPRFGEVVRETAEWARELLGDPGGGFGASQDADNAPGDDGGYFTWSRAELRALLDPEELRLVNRVYGVGGEGRMPHDPDRNVLYRLLPIADAIEGTGVALAEAEARLASARAKLAAARVRRPAPVVDRALYTNINGAFVRAFVHAGRLLEDSEMIAEARRAADRFLAEGFRPGRGMAHRLASGGPAGFGLLDDQAEFALGLLELGAATAEGSYVDRARELLELVLAHYRTEPGPLRDLAPELYDGPRLSAVEQPSYPIEDHPHLSSNAGVAIALIRLSALTGAERWRDEARALLGPLAARAAGGGLFAAGTALAAALLSVEPRRVVIDGAGPAADALGRAAEGAWHPLVYVFRGAPPAPFELPEELPRADGAGRGARALLCSGRRCAAPITDPAELAAAIAEPPR
jgi:uncharacterized protein